MKGIVSSDLEPGIRNRANVQSEYVLCGSLWDDVGTKNDDGDVNSRGKDYHTTHELHCLRPQVQQSAESAYMVAIMHDA